MTQATLDEPARTRSPRVRASSPPTRRSCAARVRSLREQDDLETRTSDVVRQRRERSTWRSPRRAASRDARRAGLPASTKPGSRHRIPGPGPAERARADSPAAPTPTHLAERLGDARAATDEVHERVQLGRGPAPPPPVRPAPSSRRCAPSGVPWRASSPGCGSRCNGGRSKRPDEDAARERGGAAPGRFDVEPEVALAAPAPEVPEGSTLAGRGGEVEREIKLMGPIKS